MEIDIIRMWLDLVKYFGEILDLYKVSLALRLWTKGTCQIAHTSDLNIEFFEFFHNKDAPSYSVSNTNNANSNEAKYGYSSISYTSQ